MALVVPGLLGTGGHERVAAGAGTIKTQIGMEVKVFETVDGIVQLGVADKAVRIAEIAVLFQLTHRIRRGEGGRRASTVLDSVVAVHAVRVVDRNRRVETGSRTDSAGICPAAVHVHALAGQVNLEVIVKEGRIEVEGHGTAVHLGGLEGTFLMEVATGNTVGHEILLAHGDVAGDAQVAFVGLSQAEDGFLPIRVFLAQGCAGEFLIRLGSEALGDVSVLPKHHFAHLVTCEHVHILDILAQGSGEVHVHMRNQAV